MDLTDEILSINFDDNPSNDLGDLKVFSKYAEEYTKRVQFRTANELDECSNELLDEIDEKKTLKEGQKEVIIKKILKSPKNKYSNRQLLSYSLEDVNDIYNEIKPNKNILKKMLQYMFNV